jgi:hypothetical protein
MGPEAVGGMAPQERFSFSLPFTAVSPKFQLGNCLFGAGLEAETKQTSTQPLLPFFRQSHLGETHHEKHKWTQ